MRRERRRLPLTALRTFEAAARLESFKLAAAELCVSATTVSNQIRKIERDWRCPLFIRGTRKVTLTPAGASLSGVVREAFATIEREIDNHVAKEPSSVTIAVGPLFGSRFLTPRLGVMRRDLPGIAVAVQRGHRLGSAEGMTTDIAIDWGVGDWKGLEARELLRITYSPVVSPTAARACGGVRRPADLARLTILHQYDRSEWLAWLAFAGIGGLEFDDEVVIEDSNTVIQAAIDGQGVALGSFPFIRDEIDAGRLVKPFDLDLVPTRSYFMLTRPGARRRPEVASVCDWLIDQATRETAQRVSPVLPRRRPRAGARRISARA